MAASALAGDAPDSWHQLGRAPGGERRAAGLELSDEQASRLEEQG
jgi:hypothetical protein